MSECHRRRLVENCDRNMNGNVECNSEWWNEEVEEALVCGCGAQDSQKYRERCMGGP
jgi:hypothetical protein